MNIKITMPGGKKVNAEFNGFTVHTDQPIRAGGENTAPSPYDTFLASLGTCAGIYIVGFCESRGISHEGIEIDQSLEYDRVNKRASKITLDIKVPIDFPEKYKEALINTANLCAVKKLIEDPPVFETICTDKV
jgi:ribosomal protein S12 methylthiotransferase accessory factor